MLTAVWVAVIVVAAFWVIGVCAAVYVLIKLAGLVSQTSSAVAGLRERGDLAIDRANAAIERAGDQITRTDAITASLDEVTANMADLTGRVTALAPLARVIASGAGSPVAKVAALLYGVRRAAWLRHDDRAGGRRDRGGPRARAITPPLERGLAPRRREGAGR
jgi:hypothetical protein